MTSGSSMLAMILSRPPRQALQIGSFRAEML
jgi:hypothetical protein